MRRSTLQKLCCPSCRQSYSIQEIASSATSVETAFLTCPGCCVTTPVLHGFPLLAEQQLTQTWDIAPHVERLFGKDLEYIEFLHQKKTKPVFDLYAAFQPFNESTQSIFPLIPLLRENVLPGDYILDLWCRTGWTGELLASLFPEQHVISIWESSSGLLGTKGFHHWLGSAKRRTNLDIVFHSPDQSLPFPDGMFSVVHGLDTLHRYKHVPLIPECLRVAKADGLLLFPHNHLTNSEPDPYFDRGEDQLHGQEYQDYFRRLLNGKPRKAFILSEKTLFDATRDYTLRDEANTDHYNACILIADSRYDGRTFLRVAKSAEEYKDSHVVVNPLWRIDLATGVAVPAPDAMDSGGSELFFRHPIYLERMKKYSPIDLTEEDRIILYWVLRFKTLSQIAVIMNKDYSEIFNRLLRMESIELVQMRNISTDMARLQSYYSTQEVPVYAGQATLTHLWERTVQLHADQPFVVWPQDGSIFTYADADIIVRKAAAVLKSEGVSQGDRVLLYAVSHPEFLFAFWGTVLLGAVAVPINPETKLEGMQTILGNTEPRLILCDAPVPYDSLKTMLFAVTEDSPSFPGSFSERLGDQEPVAQLPLASEEQEAAILFTSGSTGAPKGIFLSHGALFRTSRIVDRAYRWLGNDRFLGGGSFHTMSGLRNPCIAVLHSGASVVIPSREDLQNPLSVLGLCVNHDVTVLNVTPGFLAYWGHASQKSKYFLSHKLRMVISTGSALQEVHREIFQKQFRIPIYDYYGLTETTGACILETPDLNEMTEKGLGKPWDCLVRICEDGELAIYSENLMLRYLNDASATARRIQRGWLMTGDIARINHDGCVVLIGRKDRMMKDKNGELLYPEEIETVIGSLTGVSDVYVAGYQDELLVEQIAALIQFQSSESNMEEQLSNIRAALEERIPPARIPSYLIAVPEIPKGPAGKVSRDGVRNAIKYELQGRR